MGNCRIDELATQHFKNVTELQFKQRKARVRDVLEPDWPIPATETTKDNTEPLVPRRCCPLDSWSNGEVGFPSAWWSNGEVRRNEDGEQRIRGRTGHRRSSERRGSSGIGRMRRQRKQVQRTTAASAIQAHRGGRRHEETIVSEENRAEPRPEEPRTARAGYHAFRPAALGHPRNDQSQARKENRTEPEPRGRGLHANSGSPLSLDSRGSWVSDTALAI
jgi:hypothetical protein